jgi:tetratricopeptide (TPR) repeat protein
MNSTGSVFTMNFLAEETDPRMKLLELVQQSGRGLVAPRSTYLSLLSSIKERSSHHAYMCSRAAWNELQGLIPEMLLDEKAAVDSADDEKELATAWANVSASCLAFGEYDEGIRAVEKSLRRAITPNGALNLSLLLIHKKEREAARRIIESVVKEGPAYQAAIAACLKNSKSSLHKVSQGVENALI